MTVSDDNAADQPRRRAEDVYDEMVGMETRLVGALDELRDCIPHTVAEEVQETLAAGNFRLPDGSRPQELLADHHRFDNEISKIDRIVTANGTAIDRIVTALDGPETTDLDGFRHREYKRGMAYKVDQLYEGVNGGSGIRVVRQWSAGQWTLVAAGVTSLATIAAALISGLL